MLLPFADIVQGDRGSSITTWKCVGWFWESTDGFQCCELFSVVLILKKRRWLLKARGVFSLWVRERERERERERISVLYEAADAAAYCANSLERGKRKLVLFLISIRLRDLKKNSPCWAIKWEANSCPRGSYVSLLQTLSAQVVYWKEAAAGAEWWDFS